MRRICFLTVILAVAISFACSGQPANTDANVNSAPESPFANITDANAALVEGDRLMDENQTDQAIEAYKRAIELDAALPEPHFKLGIAYGLMELQMEQEGRAADVLDSKGKSRSEKSFERAVEAYKKWLKANPKDDAAHFNLGRTYNKLFKDEEAEKEFQEAVDIKPDDAEYQTELGGALIRMAKYHEAIKALKKALELDPESARATDLLEDAEAGRQRIDYVSKDTNKASNSKIANANANTNTAANSNTLTPRTNSAFPKPPANKPETKKPNTDKLDKKGKKG